MSDVPDGEHAAVVDRIEDGLAALEVDLSSDGRAELLVDPSVLPSAARHANAVVSIEVVDGSIVDATYHLEETESSVSRAQSLFDRIARRPPRSSEADDGDEADDTESAEEAEEAGGGDSAGEAADSEDEPDRAP